MAWLAPIAGSVIGGLFSGRQSSAQRQQAEMQRQQLALLQQQEARANQMYQQSQPFITGAGQNYDTIEQYWKALLGNGPDAIKRQNDILGPMRDQRAVQYQNLLKQAGTMAPRGSGAGNFANLGFQQAGENNRDLLNLRASAPDKLFNVAQGRGGLAGSLLGNSTNLSSSAAGNMNGLLGLSQQNAQFQQQNSSNIWSGIGSAVGSVLASQPWKRHSSGSST